MRKRVLIALGHIGSENTISRLVTIKNRGGIFQEEADEGLNLYSNRLTTNKEKLVDIFVREPSELKGIIWKILTAITGIMSVILSIVSMVLKNATPIQIRNIGISTAIFSVVTFALVIGFIVIPNICKFFDIQKAKKEIRRKL